MPGGQHFRYGASRYPVNVAAGNGVLWHGDFVTCPGTCRSELSNHRAAVPTLVADGLALRPADANVACSSSVIDLSKRSAAIRAAAERLLTMPAMSRFSTRTVSDAD